MRNSITLSIMLFGLLQAHKANAQDLSLYLRQASRSGPSQFVDWADKYYAEREDGKSGFQGSETRSGSIIGAVMGSSVGMLRDDMYSGMKQGYEQGQKAGEKVGNAYGTIQGQSQQMEDIITNYINDRQSLLNSLKQYVESCMAVGTMFSTCRQSAQVDQTISQITALNAQYCKQAITVPSPLNQTQTMLPAEICYSR